MNYAIKTIYYTIQGEGAHSGRPSVLCRFAGCNLWNGEEDDRATATCGFCDTDFVGTDGPGGGRYATPEAVAEAVARFWPTGASPDSQPWVICTGGEPLLQLDEPLVRALQRRGFGVAVETNGTLPAPDGLDWLCVSPKAGAELVLRQGDELKLVFPQPGVDPEQFVHLDFQHFFLQPMDGPTRQQSTDAVLRYCLENPHWRISLQTHKFLGIP